MDFPFLPSLKTNSQIAIPKSGEWTANSQNTLTGLVDSLKVAANKHSNISSIPDVWARPILMRSVLGDELHPQHELYVAEWRGLLAIMAMRKMRGLNHVKLHSIGIPTLDKIQNDTPNFLKVLARSIPQSYAEEQKDETIKNQTDI